MKTINTYILSAFAALILLPFAASAQTGEVKQKKTVTDNGNGTYTVKLESYVTGQVTKQPLDIIVLLDNSNSMYSYKMANGSDSRIAGLRTAVIDFIDGIYNGGDTPAHRIAVLKFNGGGRRIDKYLIDEDHPMTETRLNNHVQNLMGEGNWIGMNSSDINTIKKKINNTNGSSDNLQLKQYTETGTPAAEAFYKAKQMLLADGIRDDGRQKVVIFITDGCCGTGEVWGTTWGSTNSDAKEGYKSTTAIPNRYYAQTVVDQANALKEMATIYSIGTFGDFYKTADRSKDLTQEEGDISKADTYFYLRHVSSSYDTAIRVDGNLPDTPEIGTACSDAQLPTPTGTIYDYTNPYVSVDSGDKAMTFSDDELVYDATSQSSLIAAFEDITQDVIKAAELGPSSAVAIDAMTNQFELPAGTTADDIKLYTSNATVTGTASNPTINWAAPVLYTPWLPSGRISDYISINSASSKSGIEFDSDYIEVTGFDYKTHFVGLNNTNGSQKLIIEFLIKAAPSNKGGLGVHTNDVRSGIYNKKDGADKYELVIAYDKPTVNLPYLKIVKKGLQKGESATFRVTKVASATDDTPVADDPNTTDINEAYSANVMVSQADDSGVASATIKLVFNGYYKVEELTWSNLGYTVVKHDTNGNGNCTVAGNSYIRQMDTTAEGVARELIYTFENSNPEGTVRPAHAEDYVPNNMGVTESTPMTGGGTGETPASGAPGENPGGPVGF